jgi:hypothetical protein
MSSISFSVGCAFGDDLEIGAPDMRRIARLHEEAARDRFQRPARRCGIRQAARDQQPQIPSRGQNAPRIGVGIRRDDHFREQLGDFFRRFAVERRLKASTPPNALTGSQASALR